MVYLICIGLFVPLFGFLGLMTASRFLNRSMAAFIGCSTIFISFASFITLFFLFSYGTTGESAPIHHFTLFQWIPVDKIQADFTLSLDSLSLMMTLIITGIGFLIHLYSIGYMEHEEGFVRYFACMNLFVFSMLLLVLAGHLVLLFIGWEGVGLASYLLIGFWYERPAAASAATKAFVVNRIGDVGLLLGLLLTFHLFGTSDIATISAQAPLNFSVGAPVITLLTILFFIGAVGKSAQLPLHVWLPDAMEGPTPVSALIHAATMVTAGVYLVVRLHPIFLLAPATLQIIGIIGAATALFAALCAVAQTDLKRVLAYSTISQLGFMFLACGVGAFYFAMFHLMTHAFIKGLLFLSAGNVVHMMHGVTDMNKMGGLSKKFPVTNWLFLIGVLALSGIPPFAAFFSKDLILEQVSASGNKILFYVGLAASILTAFYLIRAYCLSFTGEPKAEGKFSKEAKEAPNIMLIPVSILAFLSIVGGFLGFTFEGKPPLESFLEKSNLLTAHHENGLDFLFTFETGLSLCGALFGLGLAVLLYRKNSSASKHSYPLLKNGFYLDQLYRFFIVSPFLFISRMIVGKLEPIFTHRSIFVVSSLTYAAAGSLQKIQSGLIRSYVAWMALGSTLLIVYFAF